MPLPSINIEERKSKDNLRLRYKREGWSDNLGLGRDSFMSHPEMEEEEELEEGAIPRKPLDDVDGTVVVVKNLIIGEVMIQVRPSNPRYETSNYIAEQCTKMSWLLQNVLLLNAGAGKLKQF